MSHPNLAHPLPVLAIDGLKTYFHTDDGIVKAVDEVQIRVEAGQTVTVQAAPIASKPRTFMAGVGSATDW